MRMEQFFTPYESHQQLPGNRVLVLAPHPDDEVFGCGATLSQMAQAGAEILVLILTDGVLAEEWSGLSEEEAADVRKQKIARRRSESEAAAGILGYPKPEFLGWCDGQLLEGYMEGAQNIGKHGCEINFLNELQCRVENFKPDLLLAPSFWEMHRDHRAVAQWALDLFQDSRQGKANQPPPFPVVFYEIGVPLMPNYLVDITGTCDLKDQAMACFGSQLFSQAYDDQIRGLNRFRSYTLGLDVKSAEAFYVHLVDKSSINKVPDNEGNVPAQHSIVLLNAEKALEEERNSYQTLEKEMQNIKVDKELVLQKYQAQLAALQDQLKKQQQELIEIKNSRSWRLTSPLRKARSCFLFKK